MMAPCSKGDVEGTPLEGSCRAPTTGWLLSARGCGRLFGLGHYTMLEDKTSRTLPTIALTNVNTRSTAHAYTIRGSGHLAH